MSKTNLLEKYSTSEFNLENKIIMPPFTGTRCNNNDLIKQGGLPFQ